MRRIVFSLFVFLCALTAEAQPTNINLGTAANNGTGIGFRTVVDMVNGNTAYLYNLLTNISQSGSGDMHSANNLSDLANIATAKKNLRLQQIHIRDFGGVCDGTTDDTTAYLSAAAALKSGMTLVLSNNLLRVSSYQGVLYTFDNLADITIKGSVVNPDMGMASTNWLAVSSLVSTGTVAYATTAAPHGKTAGTVVLVYCDSPAEFKGPVTILSAGLDSTHFAYNTLGGTPLSSATNPKWAAVDYERKIFKFTRCKNVNLDRLTFTGQYIDRSVRNRLGYDVVDFQPLGGTNNNGLKGTLCLSGAAYGLSSGSYEMTNSVGHLSDVYLNVYATNVGYPVASWGAIERFTIDVYAEDVHRGWYSTGLRKGTLNVRVKNFDASGALVQDHWNGTTDYGAEDLNVSVTDCGTDQDTSYLPYPGSSGRYLLGIMTDSDGRSPTFRGINARVSLKTTDSIGKNIVAARMGTLNTNGIFNDIIWSADIDRSGVTSSSGFGTACYETLFRLPQSSGIHLRGFYVTNSATTSGNSAFRREIVSTNNVTPVSYLASSTDSSKTITLTGAQDIDYDLLTGTTSFVRANTPTLVTPQADSYYATNSANYGRLSQSGTTTIHQGSGGFHSFQDSNGSTASANKTVRIGFPSYDGTFATFGVLSSTSTSDDINIGFGTGYGVNTIHWGTAPFQTTSGTERATLNSTGLRIEPAGISASPNAGLDVNGTASFSSGLTNTAATASTLAGYNSGKKLGSVDLTGDATTSGGLAVTLASSGVTAATYGDSTHVAQVAIDAKGRITLASNVAISGGGASDNWVASGSTNSTLPGTGSMDSLNVTNSATFGAGKTNSSIKFVGDIGTLAGSAITLTNNSTNIATIYFPLILNSGLWKLVNQSAGVWNFTNAVAGVDYRDLTTIVNADVSASAAIARSKIASGSANHVVINDGSGNLSSEATLGATRFPVLTGGVTTPGGSLATTLSTNQAQEKVWVRAGTTNLGVFDNITFWPGSNVTLSTTNGTSNTNIDIVISSTGGGGGGFDLSDPANAFFYDEFGTGAHGLDGQIGNLGWMNSTLGGGAAVDQGAGEQGHPGVHTITTAAVAAGDGEYISLGDSATISSTRIPFKNMAADANWTVYWIFKLSGTATIRFRAGVVAAGTGATVAPANWMGIRYDTSAGFADSQFVMATVSASTASTANLGTVNTSWHKFRMRSTSAGTILGQLDAGTEQSLATNVPTNDMTPFISIATDTTAARTVTIDYFSYKITGLTR